MELSITLILVIITAIISISALNNYKVMDEMIFHPPSVKRGQWYRFFSSGLIHADFPHLIFNMLALYFFGHGSKVRTTDGGVFMTGVEFRFNDVFGDNGKFIYLGMYVLALAASLLPTYTKNIDNYHYRSLGASGAVSAVVFSSILFYPLGGMGLFFIPIYVAGFIFGIIYLLISNWMARRGQDNINHSAHIFGAVFGLGFTIIACMIVEYPILTRFVYQIKNMSIEDIIQVGP